MSRDNVRPLNGSDVVRAQAVAAVLAGGQQAEVARRFNVNKATVSRWMKMHGQPMRERLPASGGPRVPDPVVLENLIFELVEDQITAIRAQLQAASQPGWLARQPAGELAQLLREEHGSLIRLLAGFRPVDAPELPVEHAADHPQLDAAAASDPADG